MAENRFNFTESRLEKVHLPPEGKRIVLYDAGSPLSQPGLCLIVTANGNKSFYVRKTHQGRPVRYHIGVFGEITLDTARDRAQKFLTALSEGNNLHAAKQRLKVGKTLREFYEVYLEKYAKPNKKSWKVEDYVFRAYVKPSLLDLKLSRITPEDIQLLRDTVLAKSGPNSMTKLISTLKCIYRYAEACGEFTGVPPTNGAKLILNKPRERFLNGDELTNFLKALELEPNKLYQDFFYVSLLTGARKSNVLAMRWNEIDFERSAWRIPETKNGHPVELPLVAEVVAILKERKRQANSVFVFPGTGATGHLADPKKAWAKILARPATFDPPQLALKDLHIHDLRRTLGSWQAILGTSLPIIGKSLGHKTSRATEIYSKLTLDPVRDSVTLATNKILGFRK
jgi:integrase